MLKNFIFSLSENTKQLLVWGVFLIAFSFRWVCSLYVWTKFPGDAVRFGQKEDEIMWWHHFSRNFTGCPWNSAASTRSRLLLTAILKGLYLLIFLHLCALMNLLKLKDRRFAEFLAFTDSTSGHTAVIFSAHTVAVKCVETRGTSSTDNNNNNVHLSCAHQRPERSHDTY